MYAAGYGIKPWRATRTGGLATTLARKVARPGYGPGRVGIGRRLAVVVGALVLVWVGLAVAAHGNTPPATTTVVVESGDTLWSIASAHYPGDDVRVRVGDIEKANGLRGPTIEVGQTLRLPG